MKPLIPAALAGFAAIGLFAAPAEAAPLDATQPQATAADIANCSAMVGSGVLGAGVNLVDGTPFVQVGPFDVGSGTPPACAGIIPATSLGSAWVSLS